MIRNRISSLFSTACQGTFPSKHIADYQDELAAAWKSQTWSTFPTCRSCARRPCGCTSPRRSASCTSPSTPPMTLTITDQDPRTLEEGEKMRTKGRARRSSARRTRKGKDVGSPEPCAAPPLPRAVLPSPIRQCSELACLCVFFSPRHRLSSGFDLEGRRSGSDPGRGERKKTSRACFGLRPTQNERTLQLRTGFKTCHMNPPERALEWAIPGKTNEALLVAIQAPPALSSLERKHNSGFRFHISYSGNVYASKIRIFLFPCYEITL